MKTKATLALIFFGGAFTASAISCGTVAAPSVCTLNVNNQVQYTFSNFNFITSSSTGGAPLVTASDITLNLVTGGGLSGVLQIAKVPTTANPNVVFLANANSASSFAFGYDVTIAPIGNGTVSLVNPATITLNTSSSAGNGIGSVQFLLPAMAACGASTLNTSTNCPLPPGATTASSAQDNLIVVGGSGNASIGQFSNVWNATFTPDAQTGVPEPSTYALFGAGLAAIGYLRRRQ